MVVVLVEHCAGQLESLIIVLAEERSDVLLGSHQHTVLPASQCLRQGSNRTGEYLLNNYKHITVLALSAKTTAFYFSLIMLVQNFTTELLHICTAGRPNLVDVTFHFHSICSKSDPADRRD